MGILSFLSHSNEVFGLDIGSFSVKLVELALSPQGIILKDFAIAPVTSEIFTGYVLSRPEVAGEVVANLVKSKRFPARDVAVAIPAPAVFVKRIRVPRVPAAELPLTVRMEAANIIPHSIDAIRLDYHILGDAPKDQLDLLLVAVKQEITSSFIEATLNAELETRIIDTESFAMQNAYEATLGADCPEESVALLNIGARYTAVNVVRKGVSLLTGDIPLGGRTLTEGLGRALGVSSKEAEDLKCGKNQSDRGSEALRQQLEQMSDELSRQLLFLCNAAGSQINIGRIVLTGGGAICSTLPELIARKSGISCGVMNPFQHMITGEQFDAEKLAEIGPAMSVAVGLGLRRLGDKIFPQDI